MLEILVKIFYLEFKEVSLYLTNIRSERFDLLSFIWFVF